MDYLYRHYRAFFAIMLTSLVMFGTIFLLAFTQLEALFQDELDKKVKRSVEKIEDIAQEVNFTLKGLENSEIKGCNKDALIKMRQFVFMSQYIKDIGYMDGNLLTCSTGLGLLDVPAPELKADFVRDTGSSFWISQTLRLFGGNVRGLIIRAGNYNAVIPKPLLSDTIAIPNAKWVMTFNLKDLIQVVHSGIDDGSINKDKSLSSSHYFTSHYCSTIVPYCMTATVPYRVFFNQYMLLIKTWLLIGVLVSLLTAILLNYVRQRHSSVSSRVLRGVKNNDFYTVYQPIVELNTGKIIGCEVLSRFKDGFGQISPVDFIPVILKGNKTVEFTRAMIKGAFSELERSSLPAGFRVSLNTFARDLSSEWVTEMTQCRVIQNSRFNVTIEITEDEKLSHPDTPMLLEQLKQGGYDLAVDDFGMGYSNLGQLKVSHFQFLKIDKSFVSEMEEGAIRSSLIPHIVEIAKNIDAVIVAEGIENEIQRQGLLELGIKFAQGYLFGKPQSVDIIIGNIQQQRK